MRKSVLASLFLLALVLALGIGLARAATVTGGSPTVSVVSATVNADGSAMFSLKYTNGSGQLIGTRSLYLDAAGSQVVDDRGNVVATPAPSALVTAVTSFNAQLQSMVTTAASAGKLNL